MSAEFFRACERLLSATANGVYQGILVALLAGLTLRLFARTNAATRHAVWFGVLLFVTALIPAHLLLTSRPRPEAQAATTRIASSKMAVALAPSDSGTTAGSPVANAAFPDPPPGKSDVGNIDGTPFSPDAGAPDEWASGEIGVKGGPDAVAAEKAWSRFTPTILKPLSWNLETAISLPHWICLCLISAWVLLASVRGGLMATRIGEVRRVKKTSSAPSKGLQTLFDRLRDSLAARRHARLRISSRHRTAVVLGFVHPVVLLPAEMDQDANEGEAEHVLRHELAHVERRDDWGNLAQQFIQAALFFHPAVWWISARLSLEREIACDDHVLEASGRPRAYALTLANVASRMHQCRHLLAPGVSNNNSQLQQRITMILNTHRDRSPRLARSRLGFFSTVTAMLAVVAIGAGPRLVLAQSPPPEPPTAAETENTTPPPPPAAPSADTAPVALPPDWPGAESGPRPKPGLIDNDSTPSIPEVPMIPAMPATLALVASTPIPDVSPVPPAPPAARSLKKYNMSIEERLDRIERILEDLQVREGVKGRRHGADGFPLNQGPDQKGMLGGLTMGSSADQAIRRAAEVAQRAMEEAQRAAEVGERAAEDSQRAVEEGQRAAEEGQRKAEQAMRDMDRLKGKDLERLQDKLRDAQSEGPLKELQALRVARDSLQRQLESMERHIKRLEQDHKRLEKDLNRQEKSGQDRSDDSDAGPKQKDPTPEKTF